MVFYENMNLLLSKDMATFTANALWQIDENDNMDASIPIIWDDIILQLINITDYQIYYLCLHSIRQGEYNTVTDYKGIWKLKGLPDGMTKGYYDTSNGRVYWGILKGDGIKDFKSHYSNVMILVRKGDDLPAKAIIQECCDKQIGFDNVLSQQQLLSFSAIMPRSFILHYSALFTKPTLLIVGRGIDTMLKSCVLP